MIINNLYQMQNEANKNFIESLTSHEFMAHVDDEGKAIFFDGLMNLNTKLKYILDQWAQFTEALDDDEGS